MATTQAVYSVRFTGIENLGTFVDAVAAEAMPRIAQAVRMTAEATAYKWTDLVHKAKLWSVEKQAYIDSISWQMVGPLTAEIRSDYELANEIETGRPAYDMKAVLQTSNKTRLIKNGKHAGKKYLIIPFRHNTPGFTAHALAMPKAIYKEAKQLSFSHVIGQTTRRSATGAKVPQLKYQWGTRLPAGLAPKMKPHHKTDIYAGMVRMNTSTPKSKSSTYLTFRTMGEWSNGWIRQARPGLYLAKAASEYADDKLKQAVTYAASFTMAAA